MQFKELFKVGNWQVCSYARFHTNTDIPNGFGLILKNEVTAQCEYPIVYDCDSSLAYDFPERLPQRLKDSLTRLAKQEKIHSWAHDEDLTRDYFKLNVEPRKYHIFREHVTSDESQLKSGYGSLFANSETDAIRIATYLCGKPIKGFKYTACLCDCTDKSFNGTPLKTCSLISEG